MSVFTNVELLHLAQGRGRKVGAQDNCGQLASLKLGPDEPINQTSDNFQNIEIITNNMHCSISLQRKSNTTKLSSLFKSAEDKLRTIPSGVHEEDNCIP